MTNTLGSVVDVDDPNTWPKELVAQVNELADEVRMTKTDLSDLPCGDLPLSGHEEHIRQLLNGYLLRAYHATRLLPHEADDVRIHGLRVLSSELVNGRLATAYQLGYITDVERDKLLASKTLTSNRLDQVCFFLSGVTVTSDADGLHLLLSTWGGEAIYWQHAHSDNPLREKLRSLGSPTIVVARLDVTLPRTLLAFPGFANVFAAKILGLADVGGDIFYSASIPATHIERLIQVDEPRAGKLMSLDI